MSVAIHWRPASEKSNRFNGGTSTSLEKLHKAIGDRIGRDDIRTLRAMAVATDDEFFAEVADVVEQVGEINVWGEW
jgi:hypothetical protein